MNKQRAFSEISTISDLRLELQNNVNYLTRGYLNSESLDAALAGLNVLTDQDEADYLRFVHHVDKALSMGGTAKGNRYHKLPTIMAGLIYYAYYPETLQGLTLEEITILAKYSIVEPLQFYENSVEYYGKPLLGTIASRTKDFMYRDGFMRIADQRLEKGESNASVVEHMATIPLEDLKQELFKYEEELIQEVGKYL